MVLDNGVVKEFDSPQVLLKKTDSLFYQLAKDAGIVWMHCECFTICKWPGFSFYRSKGLELTADVSCIDFVVVDSYWKDLSCKFVLIIQNLLIPIIVRKLTYH